MNEETTPEVVEEPQGTPLVDLADFEPDPNQITIVEPGDEEEVKEEVTEEAEPVEEPAEEEDVELPAATIPQVTAENPGEYEPKDYSFDVTVFDEEGRKGTIHTIKSVEQWEELLASEPNFGGYLALSKAERMAKGLEDNEKSDKETWQAKKDAYDTEVAEVTRQTEFVQGLVSEINYLIDKGLLPKVASKYSQADWTDPEIAKQEGVKEQVALYRYMEKENKARTKAGLKPMTSAVDAYNAWQLDESRKDTTEARKAAAQSRKEASAKVSGSSAPQTSNIPKGVKVGSGGNLRDLDSIL